jgi:chemotaxis protein MotB
MSARRKRHDDHEEHENHERWLITYADMITLLMVLFIVLFAIGQTDLKKFAQLKNSLSTSMDGKPSKPSPALEGGTGALDGNVGAKAVAVAGPAGTADQIAQAQQALSEKQAHDAAVKAEQQTLQGVQDQIRQELSAHGLGDSVNFRLEARGLIVTVVTDRVLFDLGSAVLRTEGRAVLDGMAPALAKLPNHIAIEGHTDNSPIHSAVFATNWELSTARATTVLRYLIDNKGLPGTRLAASGYADQQPLVANDTDAHRANNRRVEIVILSQVDDPSTQKASS